MANYINKVTVRGTPYYLSNLTDGSNIAKLPTSAQGLKANDTLVTEGTLEKFTVTPGQLEDFKTEVKTNFSDLEQDFSDKFLALESSVSEDMTQFQKDITEDIDDFKAEVDKLVRYELPIASADTLGGVKPVTKTDDMTYEVGIDAEGKLWVVSDLKESKEYTDSKAYAIEIVDVLPAIEDAEDRTFYLIPKASGNGYEKYWKITKTTTDEEGNEIIESQLDEFAGSSTEVVSKLPDKGEIDVDYIVYDGTVCLYYKWISDKWRMVAGSVAKVLQSTEELKQESGNEFTDYYVKNGDIYFHYRWDSGSESEPPSFKMVGSDSYNKTEIDAMFAAVDTKLNPINNAIGVNATQIEKNKENLATVTRSLTNLTDEFYALDTEGYRYEAKYGTTVMEDGQERENVFTLYETKEGQTIAKSQFVITGGSGQGSSSAITFEWLNKKSTFVFTKKAKAVISFKCYSMDADKDYVNCTYILRTKAGRLLKNGDIQYVFDEQGELKFTEIDVTEYVSIGTNNLQIVISDSNGSMSVKDLTVKVVDIRLEADFVDTQKYPVGTIEIGYIPYGTVPKTVYFKTEYQEEPTSIKLSAATSGLSQPYSVDLQEHGSHLIEMWMVADVDGVQVPTDHVFLDVITYEEGNMTPIIGCANQNVTMRQYDTANIVFTVYDPGTETPTIIRNVNGEYNSTLTSKDGKFDPWKYKTSEIGTHNLQIVCGETVKDIVVNVEKLDITISPVTSGLVFDFNPTGYSNNDENRLWTNGTVSMDVSPNFDWVNGGYQFDKNGDQYFCIKSGTHAVIDYQLFADDAKLNGKEFKLVFKSTNVQSADAKFLTCIDNTTGNDHIGIEMSVHEAYVYGKAGKLHLPYSEEDIIEFEFNINKNTDSVPMVMGYEDGVSTCPMVYDGSYDFTQTNKQYITIGSDECDLHIYRFKVYNKALTDKEILNNFIADARNIEEMISRHNRNQIYDDNNQLNPDVLAEKCPWLRVIKLECPYFTNHKDNRVPNTTIEHIYKNGDPVLDNWIATDAVHSGQGTSSNNYGAAGRNLDLMIKITKDKETGVKLNTNPIFTLSDGSKVSKVALTKTSVPVNYFNVKVNIASSENANNALLQRRYNTYNPYDRAFIREEGYDPSIEIKDTMEHYNCVVFVKEYDETQDADGNYVNHREFNNTDWNFYAIGSIGDSKKTDDTRLTDPDDKYECCVEIMDVELPLSDWPIDTMYNAMGYKVDDTTKEKIYTWAKNENLGILYEKIDGQYVLTEDTEINLSKTYYVDILEHDDFSEDFTYGWRYLWEDGTDEQNEEVFNYCKQKWIELYRFVTTSTNEEFKAHLGDYFVINSALYYYLFTTRYTMVDNRAKNSFWHYGKTGEVDEDGQPIRKWDLSWDYDNDTALGINNYGDMVYRYGLEDTDEDESGQEIFRESDSTFFCRLRDLFVNEMKSLYNTLESDNAWSAESLINQFDTWQNEFPEELWRIDIERKYIRTYNTSFINGAHYRDALNKMAHGRKKYQRRQFERNQEKYMASKYQSTLASSDMDSIVLRCGKIADPSKLVVAPNYKLKLTPYAYMYLNVQYGTQPPIQVKADELNKEYEIDYRGDSVDIIKIYNASFLRSIGDLSTIYAGTVDVSKASKMTELIIGNETEGYDNPYLNTLTTGSNALLEKLSIENVSGLTQSLDFSDKTLENGTVVEGLKNLKELYAHGSNISGAIFADGGKIETAELPAIGSIEMKNLMYLSTLDITSFDNLTKMVVEECNTIDLIPILNNAKNLNRIRIMGVEWTLETADLLNRLYKMDGVDGSGYNTEQSVLSGNVKILGKIRERELKAWAEAWPELHIVEHGGFIDQYTATFLNEDGTPVLDKNGEPYVQFIDQGGRPYDPVKAGEIDAPIKESTAQYDFTFDSWDGFVETMTKHIIVKATYTSTIRTYTVRWMKMAGIPILTKTNVPYGSAIEYDGEWPTMTDNENALIFNIFTGWNKSTGFISGDTDVYAKWENANGLPSDGTDMKDMSVAQIYGVVTSGNNSKYFEDKDYIDIKLGNDYSYDNDDITEYVIVKDISEADALKLNGTVENVLKTDIQLCAENSKSFTMAIDFEFGDNTPKANNVLMSCCYVDDNNNYNGLRLYYDGNPVIQWGDQTMTVGYGNQRNMVVLRHIAGEDDLHVYVFNTGAPAGCYAKDMTYKVLTRTTSQYTDRPLILGAIKYNSITGSNEDNFGNLCNGTVYWTKIWDADLGDADARALAAWTHETLRFQYCGSGRYPVIPSLNIYTGASFICENLLAYGYHINSSQSNVGGWEASEMEDFCNDRVYNAFPTAWKSVIKKPYIPANIGNNSTTVVTSQDYIYLPSYVELVEHSQPTNPVPVPYDSEGFIINWMCADQNETAQQKRMKKQNGVATKYWTRSAMRGYDRYWVYISEDGSVNGNLTYAYPYIKNGICPCFSI